MAFTFVRMCDLKNENVGKNGKQWVNLTSSLLQMIYHQMIENRGPMQ